MLVKNPFTRYHLCITVPMDMDVRMKAVMFGALFLIVGVFPHSVVTMHYMYMFLTTQDMNQHQCNVMDHYESI